MSQKCIKCQPKELAQCHRKKVYQMSQCCGIPSRGCYQHARGRFRNHRHPEVGQDPAGCLDIVQAQVRKEQHMQNQSNVENTGPQQHQGTVEANFSD